VTDTRKVGHCRDCGETKPLSKRGLCRSCGYGRVIEANRQMKAREGLLYEKYIRHWRMATEKDANT